MRASVALAILLALSLVQFAPGAVASEAALTDATGDVILGTGTPAGGVAAPAGMGSSVDLEGLAIEESDDALTLVLDVASFDEPFEGSADYAIHFTWGRVDYVAVVLRFSTGAVAGDSTWAFLGMADGDTTSWWNVDYVALLEPTFDLEAGTITIPINKAYVLDREQRMPIKGEKLTNLVVRAERTATGGSITLGGSSAALTFVDAMPDEGASEYVFQKGDVATGHILLTSYDRVRVSNGGATTFVFQALVHNTGEEGDEVTLELQDLPEGWTGSVEPKLRLDGGDQLTIPVLMTVPFAHDHGGYTSFALRATSQRAPDAVASLRLGVLHTPIPQPAGHHNELFLHPAVASDAVLRQFFPNNQVSMNTLAEHDGEPMEAPSQYQMSEGHAWAIQLNPGLRMGLDFDVDGVGALVGSVIGRQMGEAEVRAQLMLVGEMGSNTWGVGYDEGWVLADSDVQTIAIDIQQATPFTLTLTPTPDADYIPYMQGQNMLLLVTVDPVGMQTTCCVPQNIPSLVTNDFKLTLPLNEYHDRIEPVGDAMSALQIVADGPVEKKGRPGTTLAYGFTLTNNAGAPLTVDLDLAGTHAEAGELAPQGPVTLEPGASRTITLGVTVPAEAADGELVEVLVFAHAVDDPSLSAIGRTVTRVASGSEASPDESDLVAAARDAENETPGPGAFAALAALGGVALALRARRLSDR